MFDSFYESHFCWRKLEYKYKTEEINSPLILPWERTAKWSGFLTLSDGNNIRSSITMLVPLAPRQYKNLVAKKYGEEKGESAG